MGADISTINKKTKITNEASVTKNTAAIARSDSKRYCAHHPDIPLKKKTTSFIGLYEDCYLCRKERLANQCGNENESQMAKTEENAKKANAYIKKGRESFDETKFDESFEMFKKALMIQKSTLGEKHRDTAQSYANIGLLFQTKGNYSEALVMHEKALGIRKLILGEEHPGTADSYNSIGDVLLLQCDYDEALVMHKKALAIRKSVLGESHQDTAKSYKNVGRVSDAKCDHDETLD